MRWHPRGLGKATAVPDLVTKLTQELQDLEATLNAWPKGKVGDLQWHDGAAGVSGVSALHWTSVGQILSVPNLVVVSALNVTSVSATHGAFDHLHVTSDVSADRALLVSGAAGFKGNLSVAGVTSAAQVWCTSIIPREMWVSIAHVTGGLSAGTNIVAGATLKGHALSLVSGQPIAVQIAGGTATTARPTLNFSATTTALSLAAVDTGTRIDITMAVSAAAGGLSVLETFVHSAAGLSTWTKIAGAKMLVIDVVAAGGGGGGGFGVSVASACGGSGGGGGARSRGFFRAADVSATVATSVGTGGAGGEGGVLATSVASAGTTGQDAHFGAYLFAFGGGGGAAGAGSGPSSGGGGGGTMAAGGQAALTSALGGAPGRIAGADGCGGGGGAALSAANGRAAEWGGGGGGGVTSAAGTAGLFGGVAQWGGGGGGAGGNTGSNGGDGGDNDVGVAGGGGAGGALDTSAGAAGADGDFFRSGQGGGGGGGASDAGIGPFDGGAGGVPGGGGGGGGAHRRVLTGVALRGGNGGAGGRGLVRVITLG